MSNTKFEKDGTLVFSNDATVWDDIRAPAYALNKGGINDPDFAQILDDGDGSTGVYTYLFDSDAEEELFLALQLPHSYKEGSDITPHVHWSPVDGNTGDVVWGLEYSWANEDSTFPNTTTITATDSASETADDHLRADFSSISGTGKEISSMLMCRLYRDATSEDDTYESDAALLEFDIHFEMDTVGSRQITTK